MDFTAACVPLLLLPFGFAAAYPPPIRHGKVPWALEVLDELAYALDAKAASPAHRNLLKVVRAFQIYLTNHRGLILNYGERYRQGKTISTAFVESAVNQVVSKRFVKKQQIRW